MAPDTPWYLYYPFVILAILIYIGMGILWILKLPYTLVVNLIKLYKYCRYRYIVETTEISDYQKLSGIK